MENQFQQEQIAYLKKKYNVDKVTIEWECCFKQVMDGDNVFSKEILPDLIFFKRMNAREAMFPGNFFVFLFKSPLHLAAKLGIFSKFTILSISSGVRQTFCHKWSKNENVERNLHFIDVNGCYSEASRHSTPSGFLIKLKKLTNRRSQDERVCLAKLF